MMSVKEKVRENLARRALSIFDLGLAAVDAAEDFSMPMLTRAENIEIPKRFMRWLFRLAGAECRHFGR
jgi:hypothetical protein